MTPNHVAQFNTGDEHQHQTRTGAVEGRAHALVLTALQDELEAVLDLADGGSKA